MKIAIITTDNREDSRSYGEAEPRFGTAPAALLEGLAGVPNCETHVVCCVQQPVASPRLLPGGLHYHSVVVGKSGWMRGGYVGCVLATRRKLAEIRPDIVHGQGTERNCAISAVFSGFPNVLTVHGNMRLIAAVNRARFPSHTWLAGKLEAKTIPRSDGVVCITNYTRSAVEDLARKTWVVPNAVDSSFFGIANNPPIAEAPTILCVGNVSLRKNQNDFMRALDPLAKKMPFGVVFLGHADKEDPYGKEFLDMVAERAWCRFDGFAGREKVKRYFQGATALALPSLEDNCPMVVLEAMASGVPSMASKVGGVPDLINDGVTGLFCDPADPATMAKGVERMLRGAVFRGAVAKAARAEALARFHPKVIARRHMEIYQEVLSARA